MVLCILYFRADFGFDSAPNLKEVKEGSGGLVCVCCLPGSLVCFDRPICSFKCLETKLLNVGLSGHVIGDCGLLSMVRFILEQYVSYEVTGEMFWANLFQLIHQRGGVGEALLVCIVQPFG